MKEVVMTIYEYLERDRRESREIALRGIYVKVDRLRNFDVYGNNGIMVDGFEGKKARLGWMVGRVVTQ